MLKHLFVFGVGVVIGFTITKTIVNSYATEYNPNMDYNYASPSDIEASEKAFYDKLKLEYGNANIGEGSGN